NSVAHLSHMAKTRITSLFEPSVPSVPADNVSHIPDEDPEDSSVTENSLAHLSHMSETSTTSPFGASVTTVPTESVAHIPRCASGTPGCTWPHVWRLPGESRWHCGRCEHDALLKLPFEVEPEWDDLSKQGGFHT